MLPPYAEGMARSPFTLAAAVTAALPGVIVTGVRPLSAGAEGRFDSAVATLEGGEEVVIRVAGDDEDAAELSREALALRALTPGARAMLPFRVPACLGETSLGQARALVTDLVPGFQIDAAHLPAGPGAAHSAGSALAAVHALPAFVVRTAGLVARSSAEARDQLRQIVDRAAATGRVPARLIVRWRSAVGDDELWRFEACVNLGGAQATSFVYLDDPAAGPAVTGIIGWHGLCIGDPAADLAWLSSAPDAASDVHSAYADAADRSPDTAIMRRARLHAELEFARWLLHGTDLRREDVVEDAAGLLDALAESIREDDLAVIAAREEPMATVVQSALGAAERVTAPAGGVDTSMQTDAYTAEEIWTLPASEPAGDEHATEPFEMLDPPGDAAPVPEAPDAEAQRAARAALQRWRSSASE